MDSDENGIRDELELLLKNRKDIDRRIEQNRLRLLRSIPKRYGFVDADALIKALAQIASEPLRSLIDSASVPSSKNAVDRRGTRYGSEVRIAVRNELEAGMGAAEVARRLTVPMPTVMRWAKMWGINSARVHRTAGSRAKSAGSMASGERPKNGADVA